jgi:hypothetical protein
MAQVALRLASRPTRSQRLQHGEEAEAFYRELAAQAVGADWYGGQRAWTNGCAQHASCGVKADDVAAVRKLLGETDYKARFGNSTAHSCGTHASCGASSKILNFTTVSESECQQTKGIVIGG